MTEKTCDNCKHHNRGEYDTLCDTCLAPMERWEPKENERACRTCKFFNGDCYLARGPCASYDKWQPKEAPNDDPVKHPDHYTWIPGIECKDVIKHFKSPFVAFAMKYEWRHAHSGKAIQDLKKAIECLLIEVERLENIKQTQTG